MRETFVKASRGLLTLTTLGIISILLGFLYFMGVASSNRLLIGFDYKILIALGMYLILVTVLPVLAGMDARAKASVKKISPHLIFMVCLSVLGLIYSFLVYGVYLTPFDVAHSWIDYFTVSATVLILGLLPLLFAVKDRDRLWNLKFLYLILIVVGVVLELVAVLVYGNYLDALIQLPDIGWDVFFLSGCVLILLGIVPFLISASSDLRDLLHTTRLVWLVGVLVSFILIILSLAIRMEFLEPSTILNTEWFVWFSFGSLMLFITTGFLSSSREFSGTLKKLRIVWYFALLLGVLMFLLSVVLAASSSPEITEIISLPSEIGFTWDFYFMYGAVLSFFSVIILISIIYFETEEISGDVASGLTTDSFRDLNTTPSEMVTYLHILSKSEAALINQFKEAVREDKFRPRVYETLLKQYEARIRSYKAKISSIRKEPSKARTADKVGAIFDSALGEKPAPTVSSKSPPLAPVVSKPTASSAPPMPPPTPAPALPKLDSIATPPPMPSPSIAPPSPVSSDSVLAPSTSGDSPLDLVADARSTSIAELRGEMLKELRRLREIFKEE